MPGRIPAARVAELHPFLDAHGAAIDEGLALYFPAPHSLTGEDAPELQGQIGTTVLRDFWAGRKSSAREELALKLSKLSAMGFDVAYQTGFPHGQAVSLLDQSHCGTRIARGVIQEFHRKREVMQ